jgi:opacity protein-like surface antigen
VNRKQKSVSEEITMKNNKLTKSLMAVVAIAALAFSSGVGLAADDVNAEAGTDGMSFIVRPYIWGIGFDGEVGGRNRRTDVDASFSDVLDALDMGFILQVEGRYGRWGVIVDGVVLEVSEKTSTPGPLLSSIETTITLGAIDTALAYRVLDLERGWLDILTGARYVMIDIELDLSSDLAAVPDIEKDRDWVDPFIGFRARYELTDEVHLGGRADIGGFGAGSDFAWQVFGGLGYAVSDSVVIEAGWRHLDIDYDHDDFIFDMAFSGAIMGVEIAF